MIKTLFVSLFSVFVLQTAQAADLMTQYIDCHFANPASTDHVVVSLDNPLSGSFFYTTGLDDNGDDQNTGRIGIRRLDDVKQDSDQALFLAQFMTVQDGSKITVDFNFSMPKNLIFKASDFFHARLTTEINDNKDQFTSNLNTDDDLTCFSRLYPKNQ